MFSKLTLFLLLAGLGLTICPLAWGQESDDAARYQELQTRIEKLVAQLGSEEFKLREAATKELLEIGNPARASLEQGARSADQETADRSQKILDQVPRLSHTLLDALGEPIPLARIRVRWRKRDDYWNIIESDVLPETTSIADIQGRVGILKMTDPNMELVMVIDHSQYGRALFEGKLDPEATSIRLPLVREGATATARALTGQVVDSVGNPVPSARIWCLDARNSGNLFIHGYAPRGNALTDREGRFTFYLPPANRGNEKPGLIPLNSSFQLVVSVPEDKSYFPLTGWFTNTSPVRIVLTQPSRPFRLRFEAVGGRMLETAEELRHVCIRYEYRPDGEQMLVTLVPETAQGAKLPTGTYFAEYRPKPGIIIPFLPVVVTAESPDELTFRLPPTVKYRGKVVDGITGEPAKGAFVIGWVATTASQNMATLSAEDWKSLRNFPLHTPVDDPGLERLRRIYTFVYFLRTNSLGEFECTKPPDVALDGLVAFTEDTIPYKIPLAALKPNAEHLADAGELPLFPAAKILVRPVYPGPEQWMAPRWILTEEGQPAWIDRFRSANRGNGRFVELGYGLKANEMQPLFVPAGMPLYLKLETSPSGKLMSATTANAMTLKQGESLDLGDLTFTERLPAVVQVVNKAGKPVDGLPVHCKYFSGESKPAVQFTNQEGQAVFLLNQNSTGQFIAGARSESIESKADNNPTVEFTVKDKSPNNPFAITVTEDQIRLIREFKK